MVSSNDAFRVRRCLPEACAAVVPKAWARAALNSVRKGAVALYNVVITLVVLTVAALALIYWGGFKEESRNS
jgi:hypothetical protein